MNEWTNEQMNDHLDDLVLLQEKLTTDWQDVLADISEAIIQVLILFCRHGPNPIRMMYPLPINLITYRFITYQSTYQSKLLLLGPWRGIGSLSVTWELMKSARSPALSRSPASESAF